MDFFVKRKLSEEELGCLDDDEFYPPRFKVSFSPSQSNAQIWRGRISFEGATTGIMFDINLAKPSIGRANYSGCNVMYTFTFPHPAATDVSTQTESSLPDGMYKVKPLR